MSFLQSGFFSCRVVLEGRGILTAGRGPSGRSVRLSTPFDFRPLPKVHGTPQMPSWQNAAQPIPCAIAPAHPQHPSTYSIRQQTRAATHGGHDMKCLENAEPAQPGRRAAGMPQPLADA
ncbi:Hypothetical Protein RRSL_03008 [Ralstonia solanacearum UW551]|uniref:Uncharacterized protein n=1 Tax=Ralstonia solanacearum (strain UW551) TaxID=342110 RepID=A0AB33VEP7_RALSU|nr:Hypothetical Protein RRSL_03008 [Ralstonia solanacearum UW551]